MKRYSIFHIPVCSFYSRELYLDACFRWKGTGFGYLFLLLAVLWIGPIGALHFGLSDFVTKEAPKVLSQVPELTIVDGKASIAAPQPYYIRDPDTGKNLLVIDTTGQITSLEDAKAFVLVTETQAIFKKSEIETRAFKFNEIRKFSLTRARITGWLEQARLWIAPVFYVFAVVFSFIGRVIQALLYAAVGMMFAKRFEKERTFSQLLRLAVVAVTPAIIIKTIITMIGVSLPFSGLVYLVIALGYLFLGVRAAAQFESQSPGPSAEQPAG